MNRLRVGIAGYGVVGKRRHDFMSINPDLEVVAVCDRTFSEGGRLPNGIRSYTNYKELLREKLDVLFVSMTNDVAPEVTIAGLEAGLHVFCEKPPGRDLADVCRVVECERRHPAAKLKFGFNHRYHDSVRDALRIIREGDLGRVINMRGVYGKSKIVSFHTDWRSQRALAGGGILLDQGIHMVDMMRLFAGEFTDIHSYVSNEFWKHDVEDNAYALMRTADGVVAFLHSSATQWRHRFQLEIALTRGALILSGILSGTKSYGSESLTVVYAHEEDGGDPREQRTSYNRDNSWKEEIDEFVDVIRSDKRVTVGSSEDALRTMHLVYRIYCADPAWREQFKLDANLPKGILS